jgi:hypothetical protein
MKHLKISSKATEADGAAVVAIGTVDGGRKRRKRSDACVLTTTVQY